MMLIRYFITYWKSVNSIAGNNIHSLNGEFQYTFSGDRTKEEIVNFALRLSGPPVRQITRAESLENLKTSSPLFFVYVGDNAGPLWVSIYITFCVKLFNENKEFQNFCSFLVLLGLLIF
jgi:hypothetical protein